MQTVYENLFEDEVVDVLRSIPENAYIYTGVYKSYRRKTGAINEDGITSSGREGLYIYYIDGRRMGVVCESYLVSLLVHCMFIVEVYE